MFKKMERYGSILPWKKQKGNCIEAARYRLALFKNWSAEACSCAESRGSADQQSPWNLKVNYAKSGVYSDVSLPKIRSLKTGKKKRLPID